MPRRKDEAECHHACRHQCHGIIMALCPPEGKRGEDRKEKSLMVFVIKAPKNSDLELGSIGSRGSKGLVRRKHNEAPQIFNSASRRRHQKRWREISMAQR